MWEMCLFRKPHSGKEKINTDKESQLFLEHLTRKVKLKNVTRVSMYYTSLSRVKNIMLSFKVVCQDKASEFVNIKEFTSQ